MVSPQGVFNLLYLLEKQVGQPYMGNKNIYERFLWFDRKVRADRYPNAARLAVEFEISLNTAQRDIEFMRERLKSGG